MSVGKSLSKPTQDMLRAINQSIAKPTQETLRAINRSIAKPTQDTLQSLSRSIELSVRRNREGLDRAARVVQQIVEQLPNFAAIQEAIAEALAPNWRDLNREQMEAAEALAEKGMCVIWVPRHDILVQLLSAEDDDQLNEVLLANADAIVDDIEVCLDEVTDPGLAPLRRLGERSVQSFRVGVPEGAQTLATSVLTNYVNEHQGFKYLSDAREEWQSSPPREAALRLYRSKLILWSLGCALRHTDYAPTGGYNRARAVGHVDLIEQLTPANALQALMLVGAVLREEQERRTQQADSNGYNEQE